MKENVRTVLSGVLVLILLIAILAGSVYGFFWAAELPGGERGWPIAILVGVVELDSVAFAGLFTCHPNQGVVLQLFGRYAGTVKTSGLSFANPLYTKKKVSLRVRNFETSKLKVNDKDGNPVEIAAVVVWRVIDTAEAVFDVDNYENYVHVQSEAAVRSMATLHPYDSHLDEEISLRGHTAIISTQLQKEIQERVDVAGVEVIEARISFLAYAPEIAAAMLQRQQASAIIAARQKIVEGAVGMVEMALAMLEKNKVVDLDADRRAAMVSNLLVVLCGHQTAQPVINTGTIYH
ncbi:MAG: SPFH domain-containing protein [Bryobacteraceae bacterium]